jgi:hypothetical protein
LNTEWIYLPVSTWYGIKLEDDKIVSINLSDNNLVGEIPNEIVAYGFKRVELTQKFDIGVIPFNLEYLKELVVLDLSLIN